MRTIKFSRVNISNHTIEQRTDYISEDIPIHIFLNTRHYGTILCSPNQLKEMVIGHLLAEGILNSIKEIDDINLKKDGKCLVTFRPGINIEQRIVKSQRFDRLIVSSCGSPSYQPISELIKNLPKMNMKFSVSAKVISDSMKQLNIIAKEYRKTGGVHVAALFSIYGKLLALAEDVGRHNAVDKVIGIYATKHEDFTKIFLALSGRLTGDIVIKAARTRIPLIASLSAAINSGIDIATLTKMSLVGFVRGSRMNIYTCPERIVLN